MNYEQINTLIVLTQTFLRLFPLFMAGIVNFALRPLLSEFTSFGACVYALRF